MLSGPRNESLKSVGKPLINIKYGKKHTSSKSVSEIHFLTALGKPAISVLLTVNFVKEMFLLSFSELEKLKLLDEIE